MSQEVLEIIARKGMEDIELQLALQCAPLIAGLKVSNLLNIPEQDFVAVRKMLKDSHISWYVLLRTGGKKIVLLYQAERLEQYLRQPEVRSLFAQAGYKHMILQEVLREFSNRYQAYMENRIDFPHEMGLLLGYPVEDVVGFIKYNGDHSLCTGYWKVYDNKEKKLKLFESFEHAKESLIQLLSYGVSMADIIDICCNQMERRCS